MTSKKLALEVGDVVYVRGREHPEGPGYGYKWRMMGKVYQWHRAKVVEIQTERRSRWYVNKMEPLDPPLITVKTDESGAITSLHPTFRATRTYILPEQEYLTRKQPEIEAKIEECRTLRLADKQRADGQHAAGLAHIMAVIAERGLEEGLRITIPHATIRQIGRENPGKESA